MNAREARWLLTALLCIAGCRHSPAHEDIVGKMGLTETALGRSLVQNAAAIANSWMGPDTQLRFVPAWQPGGSEKPNLTIPVYAISELHAPASYMVAVPAHCKCVFVQPNAYQAWLKNHLSHRGPNLEISEDRLLAFMLLHEAGHIAHGDPGEFDGTGSGALNTDLTVDKQREQNADEFAVEQLKGASSRMKDTTAWLNALNATKDLSNLSFELDGARIFDHPGQDAYYDTGYTHPNFELRVLTVNDQISDTPESRRLVDNFLARRVPHDDMLYRAPSLLGPH